MGMNRNHGSVDFKDRIVLQFLDWRRNPTRDFGFVPRLCHEEPGADPGGAPGARAPLDPRF